MSTLLIIVGIIASMVTSLFYLREHENKKEKIYKSVQVSLIMVVFLSVFFSVSSGNLTVLYGLVSLLLLILSFVYSKKICGLDSSLRKLLPIVFNSTVNVILIILPFMLLVMNYSWLHPILLLLISTVISVVLVYLSTKRKYHFFDKTYTMPIMVLIIVMIICFTSNANHEIRNKDRRRIDNVFARELYVENVFDDTKIGVELGNSEELWINEVKILDNKIYFEVFIFDQHYIALMSIDLTSHEQEIVAESTGSDFIYDYVLYDNGILIASGYGFTYAKDGIYERIEDVLVDGEILMVGEFSDELGLIYRSDRTVYTFQSLDNITVTNNEEALDTTGDDNIQLDEYYQSDRALAYDLMHNDNNLGIEEVYSSRYNDNLKGVFMTEFTMIKIDDRYQLLPFAYLKGYLREDNELYFYADQAFVDQYIYSDIKYNESGIYQLERGNLVFSEYAFFTFNNWIGIVLLLGFQKKKTYIK